MTEYIITDKQFQTVTETYLWDVLSRPITEEFVSSDKLPEIVRCRDCARFIPQGTYRFNSGVVNKDTCDVIRGFVVQIDPDGFCAWGERRDA